MAFIFFHLLRRPPIDLRRFSHSHSTLCIIISATTSNHNCHRLSLSLCFPLPTYATLSLYFTYTHTLSLSLTYSLLIFSHLFLSYSQIHTISILLSLSLARSLTHTHIYRHTLHISHSNIISMRLVLLILVFSDVHHHTPQQTFLSPLSLDLTATTRTTVAVWLLL